MILGCYFFSIKFSFGAIDNVRCCLQDIIQGCWHDYILPWVCPYTVCHKIGATLFSAITLPNVNQFS